jgi:uncharacterized protein YecT (DUF1311 family)
LTPNPSLERTHHGTPRFGRISFWPKRVTPRCAAWLSRKTPLMYRAFLFAVASVVSWTVVAQSQVEMTRKSAAHATRVERELSRAIDAYRKRLSSDQRAMFDESQRQWRQYRDSLCKFEASGVSGGSAEPMVIGECVAARTAERLQYIRRLSNCEEGDLSCPAWKPAPNSRQVSDKLHVALRLTYLAPQPGRSQHLPRGQDEWSCGGGYPWAVRERARGRVPRAGARRLARMLRGEIRWADRNPAPGHQIAEAYVGEGQPDSRALRRAHRCKAWSRRTRSAGAGCRGPQ